MHVITVVYRRDGGRYVAEHGWRGGALLHTLRGAAVSACSGPEVCLIIYCPSIVYAKYNRGISCSWTVEELRAVIVLLKRPEFKPAEIEDDLHNRTARAMHVKMIKSFDTRESSQDGNHNLTMFMREVRKLLGKSWVNLALKDISTTSSRRSLTMMQTGSGVAFQIGV